MMDLHGDALKRIMGDMDDLEGKRMFPMAGGEGGATITISVSPGHVEPEGDEGDEMNKGGLAYNKGGIAGEKEDQDEIFTLTGKEGTEKKMAEGGAIGMPGMGEEDELGLPPFLRKKKVLGTK